MASWKVWNFYENYITLVCLEKKLIDNILLTMHAIVPKVAEYLFSCNN